MGQEWNRLRSSHGPGRSSPPTPGIPPKTPTTGEPDSPIDLPGPAWKSTVRRTLKEIKDDRITFVAAGVGFYAFLSIFPALIAAVGILDLMNISPGVMSSITRTVQETLPGGAGRILTDAIANAQEASRGASLLAAIIGIVVALVSATSAMVAVQAGLNIAYDVPKDRSFVQKRLIALGLIVAAGLLGGVPSPFFASGSAVLSVIGWIVTLAAIIVMFAIFYYLGPNRERPAWLWVSPGGVVGGVIWILASLGFSFYVSRFGRYAETYGPLAGVVVLMLWLYLSALAVLVGGELNAELERETAEREGRL